MLKNIAAASFCLVLLSLSLFPSYIESTGCSVTDEQLMRRRRLQGIRANILAQLGLEEPPEAPNSTAQIPQEISETFNVLAAATKSLSQERTSMCESENIYAQPISAFVGTIEGGTANYPSKRSVEDTNILAEYTMRFDFNLSDDLRDFTRADLLLYQIPITRNQYNLDEYQQHVEIKAIYESLGLSAVVSAKNVDPFERGFQAFNIRPAIQTWISQGIRGNVSIKVSVQCYSPAMCNQGGAKKLGERQAVSFKDFDESEHAPRIVVTSRNPLEQVNARNKRQATSTRAVKCLEKQTSCCLNALNISFAEDLGLNFILRPSHFEANYCNGVCPVLHKMTPMVYRFITQIQSVPSTNLQPCCAGNTFENLNIMVKNKDGNYEIDTLTQVKITSCRCA